MPDEILLKVAPPAPKTEMHVVEVPAVAQPQGSADLEKVRAVDTIFAHYQQKPSMIDLLAFYTGAMMIGEVAQEIIHENVEDVKAGLKKLDEQEVEP